MLIRMGMGATRSAASKYPLILSVYITSYLVPGTGTWYLVQVPGTRYQVPGICENVEKLNVLNPALRSITRVSNGVGVTVIRT